MKKKKNKERKMLKICGQDLKLQKKKKIDLRNSSTRQKEKKNEGKSQLN